MTATLPQSTIDALNTSDYVDVFGVLGLHEDKANGGHVLRTFQPYAKTAKVIDPAGGAVIATLEKVDEGGLFEVKLPNHANRFRYRLRLANETDQWELDDPYAFGSSFGDLDFYLIAQGAHIHLYNKLGAHPMEMDGVSGTVFAVWAPGARRVSVVGDFNHWDGRLHQMRVHPSCGVWEIFVPGIGEGAIYKYEVKAQDGRVMTLKADPVGFRCEHPPKTGSIVHSLRHYRWQDERWLSERAEAQGVKAPISIYEVHLGSWRRVPEEGFRPLNYHELADQLIPYVKEMGFTHIELLPITEFPFDGSWGYQPLGMYAPTARFGDPDAFRYFIDRCHQEGIGLILDWVAGHFPIDPHGLEYFDGSHLYEHADPRQGMHTDWGTLIYNYGRNEVANFLLSNALFWMDEYHLDGLRVDAVASMLYLDYSREDGEWIPNRYGGNENLEAIAFLKRMNELTYGHHAGCMTVAEESTAWPMVSRPTYLGGLGFGFKWNMGWMHDTLRYISRDPIHRKYHHDDLTFGLLYAFHENFILPLSHDEVVHGKGSILGRMPGDQWQRFANLRAYYTFMFTQPGKKLLFMGCEFGQEREWQYTESLDWHLLENPFHSGAQHLVRDLNHLYRSLPALHEMDCDHRGFEWIDCHDYEHSSISYVRRAKDTDDFIVAIFNFTPVVQTDYHVGMPSEGPYVEIFNSDAKAYGGSNVINEGPLATEEVECHGRPHTLRLTLPPLAGVILRQAAKA